MYCTICMYIVCVYQKKVQSPPKGENCLFILFWQKQSGRGGMHLKDRTFAPSLKAPENSERLWNVWHSQDSKLWACITNEEKDSRENKWYLNTGLRNAEKKYFSQRPRKDNKELTTIQKGAKKIMVREQAQGKNLSCKDSVFPFLLTQQHFYFIS